MEMPDPKLGRVDTSALAQSNAALANIQNAISQGVANQSAIINNYLAQKHQWNLQNDLKAWEELDRKRKAEHDEKKLAQDAWIAAMNQREAEEKRKLDKWLKGEDVALKKWEQSNKQQYEYDSKYVHPLSTLAGSEYPFAQKTDPKTGAKRDITRTSASGVTTKVLNDNLLKSGTPSADMSDYQLPMARE